MSRMFIIVFAVAMATTFAAPIDDVVPEADELVQDSANFASPCYMKSSACKCASLSGCWAMGSSVKGHKSHGVLKVTSWGLNRCALHGVVTKGDKYVKKGTKPTLKWMSKATSPALKISVNWGKNKFGGKSYPAKVTAKCHQVCSFMDGCSKKYQCGKPKKMGFANGATWTKVKC